MSHPLAEPNGVFDLSSLRFRYEPYPIGLARPAVREDVYKELHRTFPPIDLFTTLEKVGHKYVLSEKFNRQAYEGYIRENAAWKEFHAAVKSPALILAVVQALAVHGIDLGIKHFPRTLRRDLRVAWRDLKRGRLPRLDVSLRARFEFSMLPVTGGYVSPHTDAPGKLITLVLSMAEDWDDSVGGGTDMIRPLDPTKYYNELNRKLDFDEVEVLETFPFRPNQVVIFTKTFNSWHCVRPMTGTDPRLMRKTLTINIEADD